MEHNSYGQELKSARERTGLSLQAVAEALHLDPRLIEAIEGEDAHSLPAPAYVRGYIRAYAQLVRCEPDTLIARYNIQAKSDPDLVASVHSVAAFKQQRDARLMWVGTAIVISLIMITVGGWLLVENLFMETQDTTLAQAPAGPSLGYPVIPDVMQQTEPLTGAEDAVEVPSPDEPVAEQNPADSMSVAPQAQQTPPPAETAPATTAPPAVTAQKPAALPPAPVQEKATPVQEQPAVSERPVVTDAPAGNDRLSLAFDGESWIEVLDANGARLVYGLFDAQTQPLAVTGQAPFDVNIGDANHVDISINGQFVSSEPYIRRNNSARFTIEPPPVQPQ